MPHPLELKLAPQKTRTLVGESIVLDIQCRVLSDLRMETVELNRTRTRLFIRSLGPSTAPEELSGNDYVALHHIHPLGTVGHSFQAPAGSEWTSQLDLLQYRKPLRPGRYGVSLAYTYGDNSEQTIRTNEIELEVAPALLQCLEYRWFAGVQPRSELASFLCSRDGGSTRWFYQISNPHDPSAPLSASDLKVENPKEVSPVLAHLNDLADAHFERWLVWPEGDQLGWMTVHQEGQIDPPRRVSHAVATQPKPLLASPPLQRKAGGFIAALLGHDSQRRPALSVIQVDAEGQAAQLNLGFSGNAPDFAAVFWPDSDSLDAATLYTAVSLQPEVLQTPLGKSRTPSRLSAEGPILHLVADQSRGVGSLFALRRLDHELAVLRWSLPVSATIPELVTRYDLARDRLTGIQLLDVSPSATSRDLAILARVADGLVVLAGSTVTRLPNVSGLLRLVASPQGLFVVSHSAEAGFQATLIRPGAPQPKL